MSTLRTNVDRPVLPERIRRMASLGGLFVEEKDRRPAVARHAEGVARLARELAMDAGLRGADLDDLTTAARLHDVGKLDTPDGILNKAGGLSSNEYATMRTHARDGAVRLRERGLPAIFVDVARFHHERYDGLGYEGLEGEAIPYAARVVQIADVYDAMREKRPYKPVMSHGTVLGIMSAAPTEKNPGRSMHDPVLLRRFVALRLADPSTELSDAERADLSRFVASDPNADLAPGAPPAFAPDEGARRGRPDPRSAAMHAGPDLNADIDADLAQRTTPPTRDDADDEDEMDGDDPAPSYRM